MRYLFIYYFFRDHDEMLSFIDINIKFLIQGFRRVIESRVHAFLNKSNKHVRLALSFGELMEFVGFDYLLSR